MANNQFIGSGIIFPLEINSNGRSVVRDDISLIKASINHILNWPKNLRFFNESFGSRLEDLLEEPDDSISKSLAKYFIYESIRDWEKRVELKPSDIEILNSDETVINLKIMFRLRNTKIEETMIFPFYKNVNY